MEISIAEKGISKNLFIFLTLVIFLTSSVLANSAVRTIDVDSNISQMKVNIKVNFDSNDCGAAILEYPPSGWIVTNITENVNAVYNSALARPSIIWSEILNSGDCGGSSNSYDLSYTAVKSYSDLELRAAEFEGFFSVDGRSKDISGVRHEIRGRYGRIEYESLINRWMERNDSDLSQYIDITKNRVDFDSGTLVQFNKSAIITFFEVALNNPKILKDGVDCSTSECPIISFVNGVLTFGVPHFTSYEAVESPVAQISGGGGGHRSSRGNAVVPVVNNSTGIDSVDYYTGEEQDNINEIVNLSDDSTKTDNQLRAEALLRAGALIFILLLVLLGIVFALIFLINRKRNKAIAEIVRKGSIFGK